MKGRAKISYKYVKTQTIVLERILIWLCELSVVERQLLFTNIDRVFVDCLIFMARTPNAAFSLPDNDQPLAKESLVVSIDGVELLDSYLVSEVRVFRSKEDLDSITITKQLAKNPKRLLDSIKQLLGGQGFSIVSYKKAESRFSNWFNAKEKHSIGQWLGAYFEHLLIERYKKLHVKTKNFIRSYFVSLKEVFNDYDKTVNGLYDKVNKETIEAAFFLPLNQLSEEQIVKSEKTLSIIKEGKDYEEIGNLIKEETISSKYTFISTREEEQAFILERLLHELAFESLEEELNKETKSHNKRTSSFNNLNTSEEINSKKSINTKKSIDTIKNELSEVDSDNLNKCNTLVLVEPVKLEEKKYVPSTFPKGPYLKFQRQTQFFEDLDEEIYAMLDSINAQTKVMLKDAKYIMAKLEEILKTVFPNDSAYCTLYGSLATELALETSDADIAICGLLIPCKADLIQRMIELNNVLKEQSFVESSLLIETARVPVIKLVLSY